jgi:hypothetical protein
MARSCRIHGHRGWRIPSFVGGGHAPESGQCCGSASTGTIAFAGMARSYKSVARCHGRRRIHHPCRRGPWPRKRGMHPERVPFSGIRSSLHSSASLLTARCADRASRIAPSSPLSRSGARGFRGSRFRSTRRGIEHPGPRNLHPAGTTAQTPRSPREPAFSRDIAARSAASRAGRAGSCTAWA